MNNSDLHQLLKESPASLLASDLMQQSIRKVVGRLVAKGYLKPGDVEDMIQELNEVFLLRKMEDVRRNYQPEFGAFIPYFERAIYNKSMDLVRKFSKKESSYNEISEYIGTAAGNDEQFDKEVFLQREFKRLEIYFQLFHDKRPRLKLLTQLYARIRLAESDFKEYYIKITRQLLKELLGVFGIPYVHMKDKEVYAVVKPLIELAESKNITVDALRKWVNDRIAELVKSLSTPQYAYDKESLKNLMQLYYSESGQQMSLAV